jgi:hypothetical protein
MLDLLIFILLFLLNVDRRNIIKLMFKIEAY